MEELIKCYDSQSSEYQRVLDIHISHSDEKETARQWLGRCIGKLASRSLFIDAGAGEGGTTSFVSDFFEQTVAIEPSPYFREKLKKRCPDVQILPYKILDAPVPDASADMVLCSHVFYHIPSEEWMANMEKLASLLKPGGILVLGGAHYERNGFMQLYSHFYQKQFNLEELGRAFRRRHGDRYEVSTDTVSAMFETEAFDVIYAVAEWVLNDFYGKDVPRRGDVEAYIHEHFSFGEGGYRCACDQSFLCIYRR